MYIHVVFLFSSSDDRLREEKDQSDWMISHTHQPLEGTSKQLEESPRKEDEENSVHLNIS